MIATGIGLYFLGWLLMPTPTQLVQQKRYPHALRTVYVAAGLKLIGSLLLVIGAVRLAWTFLP